MASNTFWENWAASCAPSVWSSAKRACCSGGNSAPLNTKSRKSCSNLVCWAGFSWANSGAALMALKRSYNSMSCPISVKKTVTSGIKALYSARSSGVSTTALRWATTPQMRPTRSVMSVRRSTVLSHVMGVWVLMSAMAARASLMAVSRAGRMSWVEMSEKRGSSVRWSKVLFDMLNMLSFEG